MIDSENTRAAECLAEFFTSFGKERTQFIKKDGKNVLKKSRKSFGSSHKLWYCICISIP